jgi:hypothetical protein
MSWKMAINAATPSVITHHARLAIAKNFESYSSQILLVELD